jgi:pyruvate/2-oxoglutarate dehydrogenase complex dihydrolipoamide acyltransferase (E2) component
MAIKMTNLSEKVIGVGEATVLPGETKEVPRAFETSPILEVYKSMGLVSLSSKPTAATKAAAEKKAEEDKAKAEAEAKAAAEKKAKLDSLKDASDEDVAALAQELGINPAECKDLADVRKKVKAALSK